MKKILVIMAALLAVLVVSASSAAAQTIRESFGSDRIACERVLSNGNAIYYRPSVLTQRVLGPTEELSTFPTDACILMDVSDRVGGGRQWVIVREGTPRIIDTRTGGTLRHGECNNTIYAETFLERVAVAPAPTVQLPQPRFIPRISLPDNAEPIREAVKRVEFTPLPAQQSTTTVNVERHRGHSWVKPLVIGLGAAALIYGGYRCFRKDGWCRGGEQDVTTIVQVGAGPFPAIVVKQ